jgi:nucleoside 2-deoxyribosyltransferase
MRIFFAGPLTDLKNPEKTKDFYKRMAHCAQKMGFDYFWAFLSGTDPVKNPAVPSKDVYQRDIAELDKSDIMIAYMGEPTTGTGIEIEHAHNTGKPVVILYEKGKKISRMLRGCPAVVKEIIFTSEKNACDQLKAFVTNFTKQSP